MIRLCFYVEQFLLLFIYTDGGQTQNDLDFDAIVLIFSSARSQLGANYFQSDD